MALGSLVFTIIVVILGYRYYAKRVDRDIIQSDPKRATPAKMYNDGVDFMPADVYYISDFPSELHWDDVTQITIVAFLLSVLFTIYPAWRGARTQPAEALRYE